MRSVDDIASDFANAGSDLERAELIREMDAVNAWIANQHLNAGNLTEYQWMTGHTRQAHRTLSDDALRTITRMKQGRSETMITAQMVREHDHPVYYCAACRDTFTPSEADSATGIQDDGSTRCPNCNAILYAEPHMEVCKEVSR